MEILTTKLMPLPKYLQEKTTTRSRSKKQESKIAKDLKGFTTINSGATFGQNDVITDFAEVEAKTTAFSSFNLKVHDFKKLKKKAQAGKLPIFTTQFENDNLHLVTMDYHDFLYLINKANT